MKKCPACGEVKELNQFHANKNHKNGVACYCKECVAKRQHDIYEYYKGLKICTSCKKNDAMIGSVYCFECADKAAAKYRKFKKTGNYVEYKCKMSAYVNNLHQHRRNAGICYLCGKHPVEKGRTLCHSCWVIKTIRNRKRKGIDIPRGSRSSFGMCYICGKPVLAEKKVCQKHYEMITSILKPSVSPYHPWRGLNKLLFTGRKNES